ncbi:MAG: hypothetical protein WBB74_12345 [Gaiellaceae bacterium]
MDRLVLVARLKPGARDRARELIAADSEASGIETNFDRRGIFLAEDEVVFFFEGEQADESVRSILNDPVRSSAIGPWLPLFDGPLHTAYEAYFWEEGRKTNPMRARPS